MRALETQTNETVIKHLLDFVAATITNSLSMCVRFYDVLLFIPFFEAVFLSPSVHTFVPVRRIKQNNNESHREEVKGSQRPN